MTFNKSNYSIGTLFKLTTPQNVIYRYQNFWTDDNGIFLFEGDSYNYLPINYDPPSRNVTGSNQDVPIVIPLTPAIIAVLTANNFFRFSVVEAYVITKDFPTNPAIAQDRMVISSYQIVDSGSSGGINLIAQAPFNAVNGQFPRLTYTTGLGVGSNLIGYLPEVPLSVASGL